MRHFISSLLLLLMAMTSWASTSLAELAGEKLHYSVSWSGIPAATAVMSVSNGPQGQTLFASRTRTLPVVRWIYPVDMKISSRVDTGDFTVRAYSKKGREGWGSKKKRKVTFDYDSMTSTYQRDKKNPKVREIAPGVQDPLSVLYWFRLCELPESGPMEVLVTDGKRMITGTVTVLGREEVTTEAGTFSTIKVEPVLEGIGGVFRKSPDAHIYIWFTDDQWRRPVKVWSEVTVGSFTALLERIEPPPAPLQGSSQAPPAAAEAEPPPQSAPPAGGG